MNSSKSKQFSIIRTKVANEFVNDETFAPIKKKSMHESQAKAQH
jgi:hypothetical protein